MSSDVAPTNWTTNSVAPKLNRCDLPSQKKRPRWGGWRIIGQHLPHFFAYGHALRGSTECAMNLLMDQIRFRMPCR
jgi:hypothetical protein